MFANRTKVRTLLEQNFTKTHFFDLCYNVHMVRLTNKNNIGRIANFIYNLMSLQDKITHIVEIDNPNLYPCIYALWHENQCCIHGLKDKGSLNVLVSNSIDGEIITRVIEKMGFKVVRGSSERKGAVTSTMQLISRLKEGERAAIMVDGPRGPLHKVKKGVVTIAKETGAPIVPMMWYSEQKIFISLPSWDKMRYPIAPCNLINIYGEPIYVKPEDDDNEVREKIANALLELEKIAPEEYKKAKEQGLWKKLKQQQKLERKQK